MTNPEQHSESSSYPTDAELQKPIVSKLAVLGKPISHSRSPKLHRAAYERLGLEWEYDQFELDAPELASLLASKGAGWRGFSVTMPLKEAAHAISEMVDPVAEESGVVNTLLQLTPGSDGNQRWAGFNTDVEGLAVAISHESLDATRSVVIGSGATAVSALLAARRLGAKQVKLFGRNPDALAELVSRFNLTSEPGSSTKLELSAATFDGDDVEGVFADATLIISTLPGPAGVDLFLPDGVERIPLFDVAYDPWPSPLAARWTTAGGEAYAGLGMLIEQALVQVRIFLNGDPGALLEDEEAVRAVMRSASVER